MNHAISIDANLIKQKNHAFFSTSKLILPHKTFESEYSYPSLKRGQY